MHKCKVMCVSTMCAHMQIDIKQYKTEKLILTFCKSKAIKHVNMHAANFHSHRPTYPPTQRHTRRDTEMQSHLHAKTSHLIPLPSPHPCSSERNLSAHVFYNGCNYAWIEVSSNGEKTLRWQWILWPGFIKSVSLSCFGSKAWLNTVYTKREFSQYFGSNQTKTHLYSLQTRDTFPLFHMCAMHMTAMQCVKYDAIRNTVRCALSCIS